MRTVHPIEALLSSLCVDLGFCLPPEAWRRLVEAPPTAVDDFVDAVFIAEGLNPTIADRHLYRQVRAVVAEAFRKRDEEATQVIDSSDDEAG